MQKAITNFSFFFLFFILIHQNQAFACNPPVVLPFEDHTTESVLVSWANFAFNDAWEIEVVEKGEDFTGIPNTGIINETSYSLSSLEASTEYCLKIRGICDGEAGPWSFPYCFITSLIHGDNCNLNFDLLDPGLNQAYSDSEFFYVNNDFPGGKLGENVFVKDVQLIIDHNWPSDLEIILSTPSGKSIILADNKGFNTNHYGVPDIDNCDSTALFSDAACQKVAEATELNGEFQPQDAFSNLYDSSSIDGAWKLIIRDHNTGHVGLLKMFQLNLVTKSCHLPDELFIVATGPETCQLNWKDDGSGCNELLIEYGPAGFDHGSGTQVTMDCTLDNAQINGLIAGTAYEFYFKSECSEQSSTISCPLYIKTSCHPITLKDTFDDSALCEATCDVDCIISPNWFNAAYPSSPWLVNEGETSTSGTGPSSDFSGYGRYIYAESSENECSFDSLAIIETDCILFSSNQDGCDFSFQYHMFGPDVSSLKFEVSMNDGTTWETLFFTEGSKGGSWFQETIDFSSYDGLIGRCRFVANIQSGNNSGRGDIALDDLTFYGTEKVVEAQYLFYQDMDGDNYGGNDESMFFCSNTLIEGFSRNNLDCDDQNLSVNPGMVEIPCNAIDENCNGMDDDQELDDPLGFTIREVVDEKCFGSQDGSIVLEVLGGQGPYSFAWSIGTEDSILVDAKAGNYLCEITDAFGCKLITDSISIDAAEAIEFILVDKSIVSCSGAADGEITIDHSGGNAPFNYYWSNGAETKNIDELTPGTYHVTIIDDDGCELRSPDIILTAVTNFTVGLQIKEPACVDDVDGSISILGIQDGQAPFAYEWSTGDTSDQISNLGEGIYALTVTDGSFCFEVMDSIVLEAPDSLDVGIVAKDNVSCYGNDDASIEVNVSGGVQPYTFNWKRNNTLFSIQDDIYNLTAGFYHLSIRDNNGCEAKIDTIEIKQPEAIIIEVDSLLHASCSGSENGSISVSVDGGSGGYQYFWSEGTIGQNYIDALLPGIYQTVVTDRYGCKGFLGGLEVDYLDIPLDVELLMLDSILCHGDSTAVLCAKAKDASIPLDFNWSAGVKRIKSQYSDTLNYLNAGTYNLTITDNDGCVGSSEWMDLIEPDPLKYELVEIQELDCYNDNSGIIEIEISGGTQPFSVLWNNGSNTTRLKDLDGGYYYADIEDYFKCSLVMDSILLYEPTQLEATIQTTAALEGVENGTATIIPTGGTSPYFYQWDEHAGSQTSATSVGLASGYYWVTVTDFNDCFRSYYIYVDETTQSENFVKGERWSVFPNPTSGEITLHPSENQDSKPSIELIDLFGKRYNIERYNILIDKTIKFNLSDFPSGVYYLLIFEMGSIESKRVIISR